MKLEKSETNNAIITELCSVRKHPNADRLNLATVLGAQVIVGLDAKDGDLVIYFDSNLKLSPEYLHCNNLYSSKELNADPTKSGYFGKNGRVRAQKFRGEISNGYVAELGSLNMIPGVVVNGIGMYWSSGTEFTSINGVEICSKFVVPTKHTQGQPRPVISEMFHKHWDTKQLMRELGSIPEDAICYIEEKIHGTHGRTGNVLCKISRPWWKFWGPVEEWKVISGTRRVDNISYHIPAVRLEIERRIAPHLHKGEEVYYEIYGYVGGKQIQTGFPYDCRGGEFKVVLYRVTITSLDGVCYDLSRKQVYRRAEELGLEKPYLIEICDQGDYLVDYVQGICKGKSHLDSSTLCEGVVVWFEDSYGNWGCLKHKSEEFLLSQDKRYEKGEGDVEDEL